MPGGFSGNGSVEWFVVADNPKEEPVNKKDPKPGKPNRHHQSGVDDFGTELYEFVITIKAPKTQNARDRLATALATAADQVPGGGTICLILPVEDDTREGPNKHTKDQISVDWRPETSGGSRTATSVTRASGKTRSLSRGAKEAGSRRTTRKSTKSKRR